MEAEVQFIPGLEGVVAAKTNISFLDTVQGQIVIKGFDLIKLSQSKEYLDIVHLLLEDRLPTKDEQYDKEFKRPRLLISILHLPI